MKLIVPPPHEEPLMSGCSALDDLIRHADALYPVE